METHYTGIPWTYLEVKVTRPINAYTVNAQNLENRKAFKLDTQTEDEDPHHQHAPWPPRSKVKVSRSRDPSDKCWPINRELNELETPKLVGWFITPLAITRISFKVNGQRSRSPGRLMLTQLMRNMFRTGRPAKFKLCKQTEQVDPHQQ